jgi:hypothetical protein
VNKLALLHFPEQQTRPFHGQLNLSSALIRKGCASFFSFRSQAMRLAFVCLGPLQKAALFAVETKERKMIRAYSLNELFCMTRAELFALHAVNVAELSGLTEPRPAARSPSTRCGTSAVCSRAWRRVRDPSPSRDLRCARDPGGA